MQSIYSNRNDDLSWFTMYGIKVRLGYPRIMENIAISETGRYELMQDKITRKRFIAPRTEISTGIKPCWSYISDYEGSQEIYNFKYA